MGDEEFRLPGSSYEELIKIIGGYAHYDSDVPLNEVAQVAGVHPTIVSRNNAFLISVGIVQAGQRKAITPLGKSLARALDHRIEEEIARCWREVVAPNPFIQKLLAAVRIRRGMEPSTLQAHVAYSAGQKKSQSVVAGSAAVIEIMKVAGLLHDENGKFVVADEPSASPSPSPSIETGYGEEVSVKDIATATLTVQGPPPTVRVSSASGVNLTIQLQIQCTSADLGEEFSDKLRDLIVRLTSDAR